MHSDEYRGCQKPDRRCREWIALPRQIIWRGDLRISCEDHSKHLSPVAGFTIRLTSLCEFRDPSNCEKLVKIIGVLGPREPGSPGARLVAALPRCHLLRFGS